MENYERGDARQFTPPPRELQGTQERSHEELVATFQRLIRHRQREWDERGEYLSPAQIIESELFNQAQYRFMKEQGEFADHRKLGEFYYPILSTWEVIAFKDLGNAASHIDSAEQRAARFNLSAYATQSGQTTIALTERQTRILDALADAADIPHQKGQTEITIPETFRSESEHSQERK